MNWEAQVVLGCELVTWPLTETNCVAKTNWTWLTWLQGFEIDKAVEVWNWHDSRSLKLTCGILTEINIGIENAMCMHSMTTLSDVWAYRMHDYACMNAWSAWWLAICRHNFTEIDKTLEYWARNGSCSNICLWKSLLEVLSLEDALRPKLRAGNCIPFINS